MKSVWVEWFEIGGLTTRSAIAVKTAVGRRDEEVMTVIAELERL